MEFYPLSSVRHTHLQQFLRCPHRFMLHYLEKKYLFPPNLAIHRGKSVHGSAQAMHQDIIKESLSTKKYYEELADWIFTKSTREEDVFVPKCEWSEREKLAITAHQEALILTGLYRQDYAEVVEPWLVEERIVADLGLEVPFEGTIDLVTRQESLEDIKTTAKRYAEDAAHKSLQVTGYNILYKSQHGHYPDLSRLIVLIAKKVPEVQPLETTRNDSHVPAFKARIEYMIRQVKAGLFPPTEPSNWWCSEKWCNYWQVCQYATK